MPDVPVPQTILTRKTRHAIFVVATINPGGEAAVRDGLGSIGGLISTVSSRSNEAALTAIAGIGSDAWDRLFTGPRPRELRRFTRLDGPVHTAPATPGDLLIHIKADQTDLCYELGRLITETFGDAITVVDEVFGFRYFEMRDLIGFVDGTENPVGKDAIDAITVDAEDDPDFAGGSYVAVQRYVHDLTDWNALRTEEQEAAIGRTKFDNVEMDEAVKPVNSHVALNIVEDEDGNEIDIVRDNMPYAQVATTGEKGTFFIGYSKDPGTTEQMLQNMFLGDPPGNYDRLLDFTTAVTGSQFFVPTADFLDDLPPAPDANPASDDQVSDEAAAAESDTPTASADGSLGIGSLR